MGRKVVLKVSSCSYEQQDRLLKEIVGVKGFAKVIVNFPEYIVTGDFKTEDLVKAAEKSGVSVTTVSNEEFPPKDKDKEKEKSKSKEEDKPTAIVSASAAPVISKSVTGTIPWPLPKSGAANYYVYVENLNLKTADQ